MLTAETNERLTRVGPGTPCGELMRRYWIPIAPLAQLARKSRAQRAHPRRRPELYREQERHWA